MKEDRMRPFVAFVSIFGSLGLYSQHSAYRLSRDGTTWKEVEPHTLLHGTVISKSRFLEILPNHAPEMPVSWLRLASHHFKKGRLS